MTKPYSNAYYESLPKKRMGAGCLFFNERNEVLLVKPTYKPGWEIPGGVVEDNESPKQCCQREVSGRNWPGSANRAAVGAGLQSPKRPQNRIPDVRF